LFNNSKILFDNSKILFDNSNFLFDASVLSANPGQLSNVVFMLTNLAGPRFFFVSVIERQAGFFPDTGVRDS
jgi:hypothetical protein